jgi:hypothetical protein
VLLVSPAGELFMEAIDTSGNTKSMQYMQSSEEEHRSRCGPGGHGWCVLWRHQAAATRVLWLSGVVCTTHSLDLLMKDQQSHLLS